MISLSPLQVVYGDLRDVIFERLYRFHVQVARLELVLQVRRMGWPYQVDASQLDGLLPSLRLVGSICGNCLACVFCVLAVTFPAHLLQEVDRLLGDICTGAPWSA